MTKVFIGGSRRITRLTPDLRQRLDRLMERGLRVLIGDAYGADRIVQSYLKLHQYERVEVFCSRGICRNNLGDWAVRAVSVPKSVRGFEYYAAKDRQMAEEASVGFMLWDGVSRGTSENTVRLLEMGKKVVVYTHPLKQIYTVTSLLQWHTLCTRVRVKQGAKSSRLRKNSVRCHPERSEGSAFC